MKLHLGVHDHPYVGKSGVTTGDVAEWLEGKYHVMEVFAGTYIDEISDAMADNVAGAIEQNTCSLMRWPRPKSTLNIS